MSRFQSDHPHRGVLLAIGKRGFAWTPSRPPHQPEELHTGPHDEDLQALRTVVDELKGQPIRWIFGMECMPQWLQSPAAGARHLDELRTATLVHAKSRLGNAPGTGNEWVIDGQWHPSRPFLCRALTSKILALLGAQPWVTSALTTGISLIDHRGKGQWFCLSMPREAHLVFFRDGKCLSLRSLRLASGQPAEDLAEQLRKEWHRDTIRANLVSDTLKWVHLYAFDPPLLPHLPGDMEWVSEALQQHLSSQIKRPAASGDAEDLLRMTLALRTWEKYP